MDADRAKEARTLLKSVQEQTTQALFVLLDIQEAPQETGSKSLFKKLVLSGKDTLKQKDDSQARQLVEAPITRAVAQMYDPRHNPQQDPFETSFTHDIGKIQKERPWLYDQILAPILRHFRALTESLQTTRAALSEWAQTCALEELTEQSYAEQVAQILEHTDTPMTSVESLQQHLVYIDQQLLSWGNESELNFRIDHLVELLSSNETETKLLREWQSKRGKLQEEERVLLHSLLHPGFLQNLDDRLATKNLNPEEKDAVVDLLFVHTFMDQEIPSSDSTQSLQSFMYRRIIPWAKARKDLLARDAADVSIARYPKLHALLTEQLLMPETKRTLDHRMDLLSREQKGSTGLEEVAPVEIPEGKLVLHTVDLPSSVQEAADMPILPPEKFTFSHEGKVLLDMTIVYSPEYKQYLVQGFHAVAKASGAKEVLELELPPVPCPDFAMLEKMRAQLHALTQENDVPSVRRCLDWALHFLVSELMAYEEHNPSELGVRLPMRFVQLIQEAARKMHDVASAVEAKKAH